MKTRRAFVCVREKSLVVQYYNKAQDKSPQSEYCSHAASAAQAALTTVVLFILMADMT